jgi:predicted TIM-barrel fold metal-dependent hydrolase
MRCDSHVHIIGPIAQYPQFTTRTYLAPPASLDALTRAAVVRDVTRFVIVQPSFYGPDNTALLESLDALGPRGRGVAVINLYSPGKAAPGQLAREFRAMANIAGAMGWHVEVIAPIAILAEAATLLARTDVTMVIDHYGVYGHSRPDSAAGRVLLELLELPHVWMKLSAPYRVSDDPLETRPDPVWLAAIIERARERCVWGSDWPHTPAHDTQQGPDVAGVYRPLSYATLVDNFTGALKSDELASMILADNPARLYEFGD